MVISPTTPQTGKEIGYQILSPLFHDPALFFLFHILVYSLNTFHSIPLELPLPPPPHSHNRNHKTRHPNNPLKRCNRRSSLRDTAHGAEADPVAQEHRHGNEAGEPVEHGQELDAQNNELVAEVRDDFGAEEERRDGENGP
jgi:hypothetical protein